MHEQVLPVWRSIADHMVRSACVLLQPVCLERTFGGIDSFVTPPGRRADAEGRDAAQWRLALLRRTLLDSARACLRLHSCGSSLTLGLGEMREQLRGRESEIRSRSLVGLRLSSDHALDLIAESVPGASCPVIALLSAKDPAYVREAAKRRVFAYIVDGDAPSHDSAVADEVFVGAWALAIARGDHRGSQGQQLDGTPEVHPDESLRWA